VEVNKINLTEIIYGGKEENFTCMLPIRRAKRTSPRIASAIENITSPG